MSSKGIVIDCSGWAVAPSEENHSFENLLQSVRSLSGSSPVHVYLRSTLSGQIPRRYQTMLQSFGCVVTMKMQC